MAWAVLLVAVLAWNRVGGVEVGASGPTARPAPASLRSVETVPPPPEGGEYRFDNVQQDGVTPVAYDPCRPIRIVVNTRTAPPHAHALLAEALEQVSAATGLVFEVEGTTDEPPSMDRAAYQPDRYGDRWAPVLVAWTDESEIAELGEYAGFAGSSRVEAGGVEVYVSGIVMLDGPLFAHYLGPDYRPDWAMAILLHELGHLVGLDHVDDWTELMHGGGEPNIVDFGPGDLTGLALLGQGECVPAL